MREITRLLNEMQQGDAEAAERLLAQTYEELRKLAGRKMACELPGQTLQSTALVHEAWLRVAGAGQPPWENRRHFFAAAAEAMRRILIDNARRKRAARHGGGLHRTEFDEVKVPGQVPQYELLAVHEALDAFTAHDARKAELVKLRYFIGLPLEEAAQVLGISLATAKRDWAYARAWLYREINHQSPNTLPSKKP